MIRKIVFLALCFIVILLFGSISISTTYYNIVANYTEWAPPYNYYTLPGAEANYKFYQNGEWDEECRRAYCALGRPG